MDERNRNAMDEADLALELALERVGGVEGDGSDDVSSDNEVDTSDSRENGEIPSEGERSVIHREPPRMYPSQELNSSYPSRSAAPEHETRTPSSSCDLPVSLRMIIEDDRTFLMFRRFLKDQCITRNLNFWLACEHYRQLPADNQRQILEIAQAIYVKYIKCSAPQHVTILDQTKKHIKMSLEFRSMVTPLLFETAQNEIWAVMEKNELRQFLVSDAFADCSVFTALESQVPTTLYTSAVAQPGINVCGGGSLQLTDSEDSASITSFPSDDGGPRSAVFCQLTRPIASARGTMSDTETSRRYRAPQHSGPHLTKEKQVSLDEFGALVRERLLAVQKDRATMRRKAADRARKQGKSYEDIMASEWYDLPDAAKYAKFESTVSDSRQDNQEQHVMSPSTYSPTSIPRTTRAQKPMAHVNSLAEREVLDALKDLEITNQVNKKRRSGSSVLSTTSDSGVGDTWATSGLVTPCSNDRLQAYLQRQSLITRSMPERDMQAQAAAIALISNSPQPEALNPRIPPSALTDNRDRHRRAHAFSTNYPRAYSSEDSSSCFTMTSQSSTSDLFIPRSRRLPYTHPPSLYSDSDEPHHYTPSRHFHHNRRQLTTPKRSHGINRHSPHAPPTIAEHREQRSSPSPMRQNEEVLIVYHLDDFPTPYAKRIGGSQVTLGEFKEKIFARKGDYRFFFKNFCEDLGIEIMEEYSDDGSLLPLNQGKIMGRVEKVT